jgi:hypothetical protein
VHVEADIPTPNRRRAALGLATVVGLVAAGGLAISLTQHPRKVVPPAPSSSPAAAFTGPVIGLGFSVAYDVATQQVVVFGGLDSGDHTWLFDGHEWTLVNPGTSPAGRSGAAAAYDPATKTVMLFGGSLGPGLSANDTWGWNGTTWQDLDAVGIRPPAGEGAQMAWDNATGEMVLVTDAETTTGAETWAWDAGNWVRAGLGDLTVSVSGDVLAYDPTTQTVLLVSPVSPDNGDSLALSWDGLSWRLLDENGPEIQGLALNPQIHTLLGCALATYSASFGVQDSCWEWTGARWIQLQAGVPPADSRQLMVEDEVADPDSSQVLMFAWLTRAIPGQPQPLHVWSWGGKVWTPLA